MLTLSFPGTTLRWGSGSILSFTETRPAVMISSAALREATPAAAKICKATTALAQTRNVVYCSKACLYITTDAIAHLAQALCFNLLTLAAARRCRA